MTARMRFKKIENKANPKHIIPTISNVELSMEIKTSAIIDIIAPMKTNCMDLIPNLL